MTAEGKRAQETRQHLVHWPVGDPISVSVNGEQCVKIIAQKERIERFPHKDSV